MNDNEAPNGMVPVEEFAKRKGFAVERAVDMIRDGFYVGQLVGEQWYVREDEANGTKSSAKGSAFLEQDPNYGEKEFQWELQRIQRIITAMPFSVVFSITLKFAIAFFLVNLSFSLVILLLFAVFSDWR